MTIPASNNISNTSYRFNPTWFFFLPVLMFLCLTIFLGPNAGWVGTLGVLLYDLPVSVLIFLAGAGWGWAAFHWLLPKDVNSGLKACSYTALGLWLLSISILISGSLTNFALTGWFWWLMTFVGFGFALWAALPRLFSIHFQDSFSFLEVITISALAIAAAVWLSGGAHPPGFFGMAVSDAYDVVSYHLQVPREFFEAGRITFLPHNTYSNYPLGAHMLYLIGMCLRGGAYEGIYVAQLTHGLWGILTLAALVFALPVKSQRTRYLSGIFLASMPAVINVSWLSFVELSQVAYMVLALIWLHYWLEKDSDSACGQLRSLVIIGLLCGAACGVKYLSVGFVAFPIFFILFTMTLYQRRSICDFLISVLLCIAAFSPWLLRNYFNTGNPIFPLFTELFGKGHWCSQSALLWDSGHAPRPYGQIPRQVYRTFTNVPLFGPFTTALAFISVYSNFLFKKTPLNKLELISLCCFGLQIAVWAFATHMPARFLLPAAAPVAILASSFFVRLYNKMRIKLSVKKAVIAGYGILFCTLIFNYFEIHTLYFNEPYAGTGIQGWSYPNLINKMPEYSWIFEEMAPEDKLLSVSDAKAFKYPPNIIYSSVWEKGLLVEYLQAGHHPVDAIHRLYVEHGITHILINWSEIYRLKDTYGWWEEINISILYELAAAGAQEIQPHGFDMMRLPNGLPAVQLFRLPRQTKGQG